MYSGGQWEDAWNNGYILFEGSYAIYRTGVQGNNAVTAQRYTSPTFNYSSYSKIRITGEITNVYGNARIDAAKDSSTMLLQGVPSGTVEIDISQQYGNGTLDLSGGHAGIVPFGIEYTLTRIVLV